MNLTLSPPYYAVIFTNTRTENDDGYAEMAEAMVALAAKQDGYLGFQSVTEDHKTISISYWKDLSSIKNWKQVTDHMAAQRMGQEKWYQSYTTRIAKVEREYSFEKE
ncbi:MAG: antibiotic biosynthesis monooxygenase [Emcibacter sp.]|nr:antibiotic biosynthesis monooxygenase [Emcibacter sp.]